jgi:hypothetical protein
MQPWFLVLRPGQIVDRPALTVEAERPRKRGIRYFEKRIFHVVTTFETRFRVAVICPFLVEKGRWHMALWKRGKGVVAVETGHQLSRTRLKF